MKQKYNMQQWKMNEGKICVIWKGTRKLCITDFYVQSNFTNGYINI